MLTPYLHKLGSVPVPHLRTETVFANFAHGQHDMGVRLHHAVRADIPMDIEVGDHAAINKFRLNKIAGKLDALLLVQLARNGKFDFTR
jgi:hypothetical protein